QAIETYERGFKPFPEPPPVTKIAPPPSRQLADYLAPVDNMPPERAIMGLISALTVIGTGMGGLVKGDSKAALSALTGALQGWHQGQAERAERAFADWQADTDRLLRNADEEQRTYRNIMEQTNLTNEQRLREIQLSALKHDNTVMAQAAKV